MAWNGPNGGGKQTPPDLDEVFRKFQSKVKKIIGGKSGGSSQSTAGGFGLILILIAVVVLYGLSGFFIVGPAEQAVVLRFGRYVRTVDPGPHWIPRFIDSRYLMNVQKVSTFSYQASMLTKDENIVSVSVAVQYRISNPKNYLFNIVDPLESIQQATASALRQVIGHTTLDEVLTIGREKVRAQVNQQLTKLMGVYKAGIAITDVTILPAKAPEDVKAAFDDAIKAQEDEQRYINQAEAYKRGVEPIARGQAKRIMQEAQAYKQQVILKSQGDASKFLAILPQYLNAPKVTRERLYLDAVESVLSKTSKILIDTSNSNNLVYLPIDKLLSSSALSHAKNKASLTEQIMQAAKQNQTQSRTGQTRPSRDSYRGRGN